MKIIKILHFGGTTIEFIDTCAPSAFPVRMRIVNSEINHTLELNTEMLDDLRHAMRQAARITRRWKK